MSQYYQVLISAETIRQANDFLHSYGRQQTINQTIKGYSR